MDYLCTGAVTGGGSPRTPLPTTLTLVPWGGGSWKLTGVPFGLGLDLRGGALNRLDVMVPTLKGPVSQGFTLLRPADLSGQGGYLRTTAGGRWKVRTRCDLSSGARLEVSVRATRSTPGPFQEVDLVVTADALSPPWTRCEISLTVSDAAADKPAKPVVVTAALTQARA